MKNLFMKVGMITLLFALIIGVGASPVLAKKIVIKAVSFLPKPAKVMKTYGMYIKMVNERAKGELVFYSYDTWTSHWWYPNAAL